MRPAYAEVGLKSCAVFPSSFQRGRYGYGIRADHVIAGSASPDDRRTAAYAAFNFADSETTLLTAFLVGAIVQHKTFSGRDTIRSPLITHTANDSPTVRAFEESLNA